MKKKRLRSWAWAWAALAAQPQQATTAGEEAVTPLKLTLGPYQTSGGGAASSDSTDLKLRHSSCLGNVWLGRYLAPARAWPRWFLRLNCDPKVNFTPQDMW
ncbi:hypothetical protein, partial [Acinetobacter baumannii]|uniref:hypothetical protein n=1 Tax=Acinetobacter baumannii TaxID=470 RepID=UPI001BB46598